MDVKTWVSHRRKKLCGKLQLCTKNSLLIYFIWRQSLKKKLHKITRLSSGVCMQVWSTFFPPLYSEPSNADGIIRISAGDRKGKVPLFPSCYHFSFMFPLFSNSSSSSWNKKQFSALYSEPSSAGGIFSGNYQSILR